jgi:hypothetical protein
MKMKGMGPEESITMIVAGFLVAGIFLTMFGFAFLYFTDFGVLMKISSEQLNTIDLAYLAEDCLMEDGEYYIRSETLDAFPGDIRSVCGLMIEKGGVMITNVETDEKWDFGYSGSDRFRHEIFVNIKEGDEIHVGKLSASIDT